MAVTAGQTGGNESEAANILRSQGISNPSSGLIRYVAYGNQDYSLGEAQQYGLPMKQGDIVAEQQRLRQEAIAPALESLRASKPETQQAFDIRTGQLAAEKDPLIARYQNLIEQLKGRETQETTRTSTALATEYGKRGIPLSSGAYQQNLGQTLGDIGRYYGGQTKEVTFAQEADVRDLSNQINNLAIARVQAMRDIDNRIAEFQATGANQAVTDALTMYREDLNRKFESRFDDLERKIKEKEAQGEEKSPYVTLSPGEVLYNLNTLQSQFQAPYKPTTGAKDEWD